MSMNIYDIAFTRIDGEAASLSSYRGKVVLLVNVASRCGLTPQYEALEKLFEARKAEGLVVLGFPANDFGAQEPGTNEEIAQFCSSRFDVKFPMAAKIAVKGLQQHPLYEYLTKARPQAESPNPGAFRAKLESYGYKQERPSDVLWNFEKFLVNRNGDVVGRFSPEVTPDDPLLLEALDRALAE